MIPQCVCYVVRKFCGPDTIGNNLGILIRQLQAIFFLEEFKDAMGKGNGVLSILSNIIAPQVRYHDNSLPSAAREPTTSDSGSVSRSEFFFIDFILNGALLGQRNCTVSISAAGTRYGVTSVPDQKINLGVECKTSQVATTIADLC